MTSKAEDTIPIAKKKEQPRGRGLQLEKLVRLLPAYIGLSVIACAFLIPVFYLVVEPLKSNAEIFSNPWGLPKSPSLQYIADAWTKGNFPKYYRNSIIVATSTITLSLFLSSCAAFSFSKMRFRGRTWLFTAFLAGMMIPVQMIVVPLFVVLRQAHLLNTPLALILPYVGLQIPFSTFLLTNFFKSIPDELIDAATMDGGSAFAVYWRIMIPLSKPVLASLTIFLFMDAWNELLLALTFISTDNWKTIPIGLLSFQGKYTTEWNSLIAGMLIASLPSLAVYAILQKQFIRGMTVGALKG